MSLVEEDLDQSSPPAQDWAHWFHFWILAHKELSQLIAFILPQCWGSLNGQTLGKTAPFTLQYLTCHINHPWSSVIAEGPSSQRQGLVFPQSPSLACLVSIFFPLCYWRGAFLHSVNIWKMYTLGELLKIPCLHRQAVFELTTDVLMESQFNIIRLSFHFHSLKF